MDRVIGVVGCTKKFPTVKKTANHEPTLRLYQQFVYFYRLVISLMLSLVDDISAGALARAAFMISKE